MALSVIICDDHPIFRDGVKSTLNSVFDDCEIREVGHMDALEEALSHAVPNLLLIDIFSPGMDPEAGIEALRNAHPFMGIMVISMLTKPGAVGRLFRVGADGFVAKTAPPGSLKKGLTDVMAGKSPVYMPDSDNDQPAQPKGNMVDSLPPRQTQVFHYICLGMSNKEIAAELDLSLSTVRAHISVLFSKLGVSNRTEAASYGVRFGILSYSGSHRKYCKFIGPSKNPASVGKSRHIVRRFAEPESVRF